MTEKYHLLNEIRRVLKFASNKDFLPFEMQQKSVFHKTHTCALTDTYRAVFLYFILQNLGRKLHKPPVAWPRDHLQI